jgi:hypothetical protein
LHDICFEAVEEVKHLVLLARRHPEVLQRGAAVVQQALPLALGDAQARVGGRHVAAAVVGRAPSRGDEEVDDQLAVFPEAILALALPVVLEEGSFSNRPSRSSVAAAIAS